VNITLCYHCRCWGYSRAQARFIQGSFVSNPVSETGTKSSSTARLYSHVRLKLEVLLVRFSFRFSFPFRSFCALKPKPAYVSCHTYHAIKSFIEHVLFPSNNPYKKSKRPSQKLSRIYRTKDCLKPSRWRTDLQIPQQTTQDEDPR